MNKIHLRAPTFTGADYLASELLQIPLDKEVEIDFSNECHVFVTHALRDKKTNQLLNAVLIYDAIHCACELVNKDPSLITYYSGNVYEAQSYNEYCEIHGIQNRITATFKHHWAHTVVDIHEDLGYQSVATKGTIRPKYFLCLNKQERPNKLLFLSSLADHNLLFNDNGVITAHWGHRDVINIGGVDVPLNEDLQRFLPIELGEDDPERTHVSELNKQFVNAHANTYFDVIVETLAGHPLSNSIHADVPNFWRECFFSEKTFRSIYYMRPFLLFGNVEALAVLKRWGFKTFEGVLFDESYDNCYSMKERADKICAETKRITEEYTLQELHDKIYSKEVQDILRHNRNHLLTIAPRKARAESFEPTNFYYRSSMDISVDNPPAPLVVLQNHDFSTGNYWALYDKLVESPSVRREIEQVGGLYIDYGFEAVIIVRTGEGCEDLVHIYDLLLDNLEKAKINPNIVTYISGNTYEYDNYTEWSKQNHSKPKFKQVIGRQTQIPATYYCEDLSYTTDDYKNTGKSHYALTMHRRPGMHRVHLANRMQERNLLDDSKLISKFNWGRSKHQEIITDSPAELLNILPKNTPEDDQICYSEDYPDYYKKMFGDTYYSIESETQADLHLETAGKVIKELYPYWRRHFFTEKIWRNIYWKRPFLLIGDAGMLHELQMTFGLKSLDGLLFDESYDREPDWQKRTDMMLYQHENIINNYSLTELHDIIYSKEVQDILEYNRTTFIEYAKRHK